MIVFSGMKMFQNQIEMNQSLLKEVLVPLSMKWHIETIVWTVGVHIDIGLDIASKSSQ